MAGWKRIHSLVRTHQTLIVHTCHHLWRLQHVKGILNQDSDAWFQAWWTWVVVVKPNARWTPLWWGTLRPTVAVRYLIGGLLWGKLFRDQASRPANTRPRQAPAVQVSQSVSQSGPVQHHRPLPPRSATYLAVDNDISTFPHRRPPLSPHHAAQTHPAREGPLGVSWICVQCFIQLDVI